VLHRDNIQIKENLKEVRKKIETAARKAGRNPDEITLVAVTKTFRAEMVSAAVAAGITDVGESKVQEGIAKIEQLGKITRWHLIGHLQSNKAAKAVAHFDMIQSLDTIELAEKVSELAARDGKRIECLIEINSSGETEKFGMSPLVALETADSIAALPGITLRGLMTVGPLSDDSDMIKRAFEIGRAVFEKVKKNIGPDIDILSMGMSSDYELAIGYGSTMIRIGSAIFGARPRK